jgi:phosphoribosyl-ATP pyrophosphohydrolase
MKVKSIRIPEEIDRAIDYVARSEKLEKNSSLRKLTRLGFEVYMAKSYARGKLTLREAADLLNLTLAETIDLFGEMGIKGNISAKDVMDALKARSSEGSGLGGGHK